MLDKLLGANRQSLTLRRGNNGNTSPSAASYTQFRPKSSAKPVVIEVVGASPGSPETQFLYHAAAAALLSSQHNDVPLPGRSGAVLWLDTSNRFEAIHLHRLLHSLMTSSPRFPFLPTEQVAALATSCLQHLHSFAPQSSASLLATLAAIPAYLFKLYAHHSAPCPVRLIIFSDASAFYWAERNNPQVIADRRTPDGSVQHYEEIVGALRALQLTFATPLLAATVALQPPRFSPTRVSLRSHLPKPWSLFVDLKVVVARDVVTKFGPGMSAQEALRERATRGSAVKAAGYRAWAVERSSGGGEDDRGGRRDLGLGVGFKITVDGAVQLED